MSTFSVAVLSPKNFSLLRGFLFIDGIFYLVGQNEKEGGLFGKQQYNLDFFLFVCFYDCTNHAMIHKKNRHEVSQE